MLLIRFAAFCYFAPDYLVTCFRGISSVVRKCVEKDTGVEYAVKIVDLTLENDNQYEMDELRESTLKEIQILQACAHQPFISKYLSFFLYFYVVFFFYAGCLQDCVTCSWCFNRMYFTNRNLDLDNKHVNVILDRWTWHAANRWLLRVCDPDLSNVLTQAVVQHDNSRESVAPLNMILYDVCTIVIQVVR